MSYGDFQKLARVRQSLGWIILNDINRKHRKLLTMGKRKTIIETKKWEPKITPNSLKKDQDSTPSKMKKKPLTKLGKNRKVKDNTTTLRLQFQKELANFYSPISKIGWIIALIENVYFWKCRF